MDINICLSRLRLQENSLGLGFLHAPAEAVAEKNQKPKNPGKIEEPVTVEVNPVNISGKTRSLVPHPLPPSYHLEYNSSSPFDKPKSPEFH